MLELSLKVIQGAQFQINLSILFQRSFALMILKFFSSPLSASLQYFCIFCQIYPHINHKSLTEGENRYQSLSFSTYSRKRLLSQLAVLRSWHLLRSSPVFFKSRKSSMSDAKAQGRRNLHLLFTSLVNCYQ